MLGTTLALFGVVGGLVETVCLTLSDQGTTEDGDAQLIMEKRRNKATLQSQTTIVNPEVVDIVETADIGVKAKPLLTRQRSNRVHAS